MFLRNDHINFCEHLGSHYAGFEIIGIPVVEGSKEWAWQMLKQNYILVGAYWGDDVIVSPGGQLDCEVIPIKAFGKRKGIPITEQDFIFHAETNGWQIYKEPKYPKPLLADAQVGDLCKHRNGDWSQIIDTNGTYIQGQPIRTTLKDIKEINRNFCLSGSHFTMQFGGVTMQFGGEYDIIHTEPLAPEGTAEWALQMWKLGNDIRNETGVVLMADYESEEIRVKHLVDVFPSGWQIYKDPKIEPPKEPDYVICKRCGGSKSAPNPAVSNTAYTTCSKCGGTGYEIKEQKPDNLYLSIKPSNLADWCFDEKNLLVLVDDNFKGILGENITREQVGEIAKLLTEPAIQYKVGDWVEVTARENIYQDKITFSGIEFGKPHVLARKTKTLKFDQYTGKCFDEKLCVQITRKLSPSEVIVKIGCLSGTVEKSSLFHKIGFILVTEAGNCWISFDALDTQTRGLVDSLLKAREEECQ